MKKFNSSDKKELIEMAKVCMEDKGELTSVFKEYAKKKNMAYGSVRNYYYNTIKNCKKDDVLCKKLGVNNNMFPKIAKAFTESEERQLLKEILFQVSKGSSVRKAIYNISNGNETLALRNQNKYRNILVKNRPMVSEVIEEIKRENGECVNPYKKGYNAEKCLKLEGEINQMIERLFCSIKKENVELLKKIQNLQKENESLKNIVKKYLESYSITKETLPYL